MTLFDKVGELKCIKLFLNFHCGFVLFTLDAMPSHRNYGIGWKLIFRYFHKSPHLLSVVPLAIYSYIFSQQNCYIMHCNSMNGFLKFSCVTNSFCKRNTLTLSAADYCLRSSTDSISYQPSTFSLYPEFKVNHINHPSFLQNDVPQQWMI